MSTRATVHFQQGGKDMAIVYRHPDGYPEGLGQDLRDFLEECKQLKDNRFTDASYLAAKWVVCDSARYVRGDHRLEFISVGVVLKDPIDIEYRYLVACDGGIPKITVERI